MPKIEASIFINANVEKIFVFMASPHNLLKIWPSLLKIKYVQLVPRGGYHLDWTYKMAGLRFEGQAESTEFTKNRRIVYTTQGTILSTSAWTYRQQDGGTQVELSVNYTIPSVLLAKLAGPVVQKINERECETILANLKTCMEIELPVLGR